ncbi:MAG: hypothetical protein KGM43_19880 [Planctomycetota bacterium]|nr:hypothetical protein [Planctomycetota bacterium]
MKFDPARALDFAAKLNPQRPPGGVAEAHAARLAADEFEAVGLRAELRTVAVSRVPEIAQRWSWVVILLCLAALLIGSRFGVSLHPVWLIAALFGWQLLVDFKGFRWLARVPPFRVEPVVFASTTKPDCACRVVFCTRLDSALTINQQLESLARTALIGAPALAFFTILRGPHSDGSPASTREVVFLSANLLLFFIYLFYGCYRLLSLGIVRRVWEPRLTPAAVDPGHTLGLLAELARTLPRRAELLFVAAGNIEPSRLIRDFAPGSDPTQPTLVVVLDHVTLTGRLQILAREQEVLASRAARDLWLPIQTIRSRFAIKLYEPDRETQRSLIVLAGAEPDNSKPATTTAAERLRQSANLAIEIVLRWAKLHTPTAAISQPDQIDSDIRARSSQNPG